VGLGPGSTVGPMEMEVLDWATYGIAMQSLAQDIADSGFEPDIILAVARGGLFIAGSLGYALEVKNLHVMNVEYYTGIGERMPVPLLLPPLPELIDLTDAKVLVADDISDTGHTLEAVKEFCKGKVGEVRVACLYQKKASVVPCDYVWKVAERWIEFPWSSEAAMVKRSEPS